MITSEQRELRRKYIGSSDAAAIMGLDRFKSAAEVMLDKRGEIEEFEGNDATERGNLLEPVILAWAEQQLSGAFVRDLMKIHDNGILAANFDGIQPKVHTGGGEGAGTGGVNDEPFIVEAKSSSDPAEWGEAGTDEVPDRVLVQVHHAMYVAGPEYRVAYVPVLLPGYRSFDFRLYRIPRSDEAAEAIAARCVDFMERCVRGGELPENYKPPLEVLKRMRRQPNKTVPLADNLIDELIVTRAAKKQAAEDCEETERKILEALGDAEAGEGSDGQLITYMETKRKGYVVEATSYRSLRVKAKKQGKLNTAAVCAALE